MLLALSGCGQKAATTQKELYAMDTVMSFRVYEPDGLDLCDTCIQIVQSLESALSVTDPDSALYAINAAGQGQLPDSAAVLLTRTLELCRRTDGALDPTVYPIVRLWGFPDRDYRVPSQAELAQALSRVGYNNATVTGTSVQLAAGTQLDLGSVAKGYAGQLCAERLTELGVSACLNLGGNTQTVGDKPDGTPWQIGIADPDDAGSAIAVLTLQGTNAIVTSGDYQRCFTQAGQRYHHIMDPATGYPADSGLRSVTIVARDGLLADGLSTALFVMGLEEATDFWRQSDDFETVLIDQNRNLYVTQGLADRITGCTFTVITR